LIMADTSIWSEQPPAWLQKRAIDQSEHGQWGQLIGSVAAAATQSLHGGTNFFDAFHDVLGRQQDSMFDVKQKSALLSVESQKAQLDMQNMQIEDQRQGAKEFPEWMRATGGDPNKMISTPFTGSSQAAAQMVEKAQQTAWMRVTQKAAVDAKLTDADNKVKIANIKAQTDAKRIQAMGDIAAMHERAAKAGKQYEFEQLQSDWNSAQQELSVETDPTRASALTVRMQQNEARMRKLSMFAAQVPSTATTESTTTTDPVDPYKKKTVTVKKTGPDASGTVDPADPLGILK
jgi:hypothetical protein